MFWHILAMLCEMFSITPIMTNGYEEDHCMASTLTRFESTGFYLREHLKTLVYKAPVDNKEALHHHTVDACQTIHNYPGIFELMWRSMMRCVKGCIESHEGHFEHLL
jgi:hypothetical protein